jgi:hypothetical protein
MTVRLTVSHCIAGGGGIVAAAPAITAAISPATMHRRAVQTTNKPLRSERQVQKSAGESPRFFFSAHARCR